MGCDIHCILQKKSTKPVEGIWETMAELDLGRNYTLFGILAGVRGSLEPIVRPRGMPEDLKHLEPKDVISINIPSRVGDADEGKRVSSRVWLGEHGFSWLSLEELLSHYFIEWKNEEIKEAMDPLFDEIVKYVKKKGDYRIVFGFDS